MGKIFLRRVKKDSALVPYLLETDIEEEFLNELLGEVVISPSFFSGFSEPGKYDRNFYTIGLADTGDIALKRVFAVVPYGTKGEESRQLTGKVYASVLDYGKRVARVLPEIAKFIDEVGEAIEISSPERL